MSRNKKISASEIRAEMARKRITRRQIAQDLSMSYSYVKKIVAGVRDAGTRRAQIMEYIKEKAA
jgi:hypothetical protein